MNALAENLRRLRYDFDLTQKSLAKKIESNQQTISEIERGLRLPDIILLCRISDFFNVSVDDILYNTSVRAHTKYDKQQYNISSELLMLLNDDKDDVDLIVDFLIYRKKIKEKRQK